MALLTSQSILFYTGVGSIRVDSGNTGSGHQPIQVGHMSGLLVIQFPSLTDSCHNQRLQPCLILRHMLDHMFLDVGRCQTIQHLVPEVLGSPGSLVGLGLMVESNLLDDEVAGCFQSALYPVLKLTPVKCRILWGVENAPDEGEIILHCSTGDVSTLPWSM